MASIIAVSTAGNILKPCPPGSRNLRVSRCEDAGDSRGGQDRIYAVPGKENELWIAAWDGLYFKTAIDSLFQPVPRVEEIHAFGFGKAVRPKAYPALYLVGVIDGQRGIFRSNDRAKSWTRINDDLHQWGLILQITGDPKKYGRVYVGTHGRGAMYGDPERL